MAGLSRARKMRCFVIAVIAFVAANATTNYEWAGIFETPNTNYVWTAQKKSGTYADPTMDVVFLSASAATEAALNSLIPMGNSSIALTCTTVAVPGVMTPGNNQCYRLQFDNDLHTSSYKIDTVNTSHLAIFAQHFPTEFERNTHYLQDIIGTDIEPVAQIPAAAVAVTSDDKPWGEAMGATILVNLSTFVGVLFVFPLAAYILREYPEVVFSLTNAFAAGALLAAAFYLMLYEATHLIVKPTEGESTAWWGSLIIGGYLVASIVDFCMTLIYRPEQHEPSKPLAIDSCFTPATKELDMVELNAHTCFDGRSCAISAPGTGTGAGNGTSEQGESWVGCYPEIFGKLIHNENSVRILSSVLIGDFIHNLVDGIVIGAAFVGCSSSMAWGITGSTIAHELAQEIADYIVLTSPVHGNLTPVTALLLNFLSGTSVILGAIIVLASNVSNFDQGCLLAFGGGVYLQIAASECMPRVYEYAKSIELKLGSILAFSIGAIAIGLVLLKHEHCVPSTATGAAAGGHAH